MAIRTTGRSTTVATTPPRNPLPSTAHMIQGSVRPARATCAISPPPNPPRQKMPMRNNTRSVIPPTTPPSNPPTTRAIQFPWVAHAANIPAAPPASTNPVTNRRNLRTRYPQKQYTAPNPSRPAALRCACSIDQATAWAPISISDLQRPEIVKTPAPPKSTPGHRWPVVPPTPKKSEEERQRNRQGTACITPLHGQNCVSSLVPDGLSSPQPTACPGGVGAVSASISSNRRFSLW